MDNFTSNQCNFSILGGNITGTYQFLASFYGLRDMSNEFQRVMDSRLERNPFTNYYLGNSLVASKGSFLEHRNTVFKNLWISDNCNFAVHWSNGPLIDKKSI